ncbi:MAG: hypothetical protein OEW40_07995 [Cyclobacteriaceae bacterium]|nr:hypothetical protein [Cyclobacteriaceae bacterium]
MDEDIPPLKVWAYSAIMTLGFLSLFLGYTYSPFGPYAKIFEAYSVNIQKALIEKNTRDKSAISIVILGSSLTDRALLDAAEIEQAIAEQTNKRVNVLRVALYGLNMKLAERINFFKYIVRYPPKYLFLENVAINLDDENSMEIPLPVDAALLYLRNKVRVVIGLAPHPNYYEKWYNFDTKPFAESDFYTNNFDSVAFKSLQSKRRSVRRPSINEIANEAYQALSKMNSKVIFLGMPQSDKLQTNFLDEGGNVEFSNVQEFYRQHYNIDSWEYPGQMDDSYFMDGIHLNYEGSKKYQSWFVSQFASMK